MIERNFNIKNLEKELKDLRDLEKKLEKSTRRKTEGKIHVHFKNSKNIQFYIKKDGKRIYIKKKDLHIAKNISQIEYDKKVLRVIQKRIRLLEKLLDSYEISVDEIFQNLSEGKKMITDPIWESDEEFIRSWYEKNPGQQNPIEIINPQYTNRNEAVRSKSEKILADLFDKKGIPYIYEPRIVMKDGKIRYPDFIVLNVRLRKVYIFEHFGMMGNEEYEISVAKKLYLYHENGIHWGVNLLYTFEGGEKALNKKEVDWLINTYLL